MEKPAHFMVGAVDWDTWHSTRVFMSNNNIEVRSKNAIATFDHKRAEASYPGITQACKDLANMGCDDHFVTSVLKVCILQADGLDLSQFLAQSQLLPLVETALTIGLSGEDFAATLLDVQPGSNNVGLPDNMDAPPY